MDKDLPVSAWPEWKIIEKIGEGSFGSVFKAQRCEQGKTFYSAIKIISIPGSQSELNSVRAEIGNEHSVREYFWNLVEECIQEVSTMEYFRGNSYVVSVEDFKVVEYLDAFGWEISIRMEYLTSFMDYCAEKQLTEREVIQLGLDLSKALEYCRKLNIIHRDIKPENIFVSRFGDFKLGDFGIARELERTMSGFSKKGTYSYMAPEMYKGERYDSRVDIYSLGIVLYKLMNRNRLPFLSLEKQLITYRDKENALTKRMSGEKMKKPVDAGNAFAEIIMKACAYNPQDRYQTPEEFYKDLEDLKNGRFRKKEFSVSEQKTESSAESVRRTGNGQDVRRHIGQDAVNRNGVKKSAESVKTDKTLIGQNTTGQGSSEEKSRSEYSSESVRDRRGVSEERQRENVQKRPSPVSSERRKKRKKRAFRMEFLLFGAAILMLVFLGVYAKFFRDTTGTEDKTTMEDRLENSSQDNVSDDLQAAIKEIQKRATTIVDNLETYDWIGEEGDRLRYFNHDNGEYMKVLVYPARSEDNVYEEYYYWDEKLFFAYIWYDTKAEMYYYNDDGELIRWIDDQEICHDNETDNPEYVKRGEKYWKRSVEELK